MSTGADFDVVTGKDVQFYHNLLAGFNSDFEIASEEWSEFDGQFAEFAIATDCPRTGFKSTQINLNYDESPVDDPSFLYLYPPIREDRFSNSSPAATVPWESRVPVIPGMKYTGELWARMNPAGTGDEKATKVSFCINWQTPANVLVSTIKGSCVVTYANRAIWQRAVISGVAPATATKAQIEIQITSNDGTGGGEPTTIYLDDVSFFAPVGLAKSISFKEENDLIKVYGSSPKPVALLESTIQYSGSLENAYFSLAAQGQFQRPDGMTQRAFTGILDMSPQVGVAVSPRYMRLEGCKIKSREMRASVDDFVAEMVEFEFIDLKVYEGVWQ